MIAHFADFIVNTAGFFIAIAVIIITYYKWSFQYWERKRVPFLPPSIPFGNGGNPIGQTRTAGIIIKDTYDSLRLKGAKFGGMYFLTRPVFLPIDPDIVRSVLTKDFK